MRGNTYFSRLTSNWLISLRQRSRLRSSCIWNAPTNFYLSLSRRHLHLALLSVVSHAHGVCVKATPASDTRRKRVGRQTYERTDGRTALPAHWWNWLFMLLPLTSLRICVALLSATAAAAVSVEVGVGVNWNWIFGIKFLFTLRRFLVCLHASRKSVRCARVPQQQSQQSQQ